MFNISFRNPKSFLTTHYQKQNQYIISDIEMSYLFKILQYCFIKGLEIEISCILCNYYISSASKFAHYFFLILEHQHWFVQKLETQFSNV